MPLFDPVMWPPVGVFICFNNSYRTLSAPETSIKLGLLPVTLVSYDKITLILFILISPNRLFTATEKDGHIDAGS